MATTSSSNLHAMELGTDYGGLNLGHFQRCHNYKGFWSCVGFESEVFNGKIKYRWVRGVGLGVDNLWDWSGVMGILVKTLNKV